VFANALTPDAKLATIQAQALKAVQAAKNNAVERAAAVCLRRVDAAGLHTCSAKTSECKIVPIRLPLIRMLFHSPAAHSLQCQFRAVACKHSGCASVHSAIHDEEHCNVCEWIPLECVLCKLPIAACSMQVPSPYSSPPALPSHSCVTCHFRSTPRVFAKSAQFDVPSRAATSSFRYH
jgi:hypothetical protein